jgi:predicted nucleic acid-binding protein
MIVVANTTPIISLASINRLDILEKLFGKIIIAEAVYSEIKAKRGYGYEQIDSSFIKVQGI